MTALQCIAIEAEAAVQVRRFRAPTAEYTYSLRSECGRHILQQMDVYFEFDIEDEGENPRVDVVAVYLEGDTDLLMQPGWRRQMGLDIADQIQSDAAFCDGLIEGTCEGEAASSRHSADLRGLRNWHQGMVMGARL